MIMISFIYEILALFFGVLFFVFIMFGIGSVFAFVYAKLIQHRNKNGDT